jgi:hypothetical protein
MQDLVIFVIQRQQQASAQQVIPNKDRYFVLPQGVDTPKTSTLGGSVDHIIVNQGGGMQQFHQGRSPA